ncbi:hypothetical protein AKJ39_04775 [candidate division MSBL1 archaeon SCGC-AAA259J03]|uniref:Archaeal Type IV pilin N-terminal domain-containing protein n=1 Tax=candidate division MSBL1 archaeon SCGC-AAA259J03 TaxID=1698269 RepID=A0A656YUP6_9EURY|nr:hypothetical protein AKJ39_04775 [candidate division MSBL1 archaeon SCGC-AAA259J03]
MSTKLSGNEAGISNLVTTLILIAVAVVGGAFAYTAFRNQAQSATGGKHVRVQSLDLTVVPSGSLFSVTVKNSGTERLENIKARLITSSGSWTVGSPPSFADVEDIDLTSHIKIVHRGHALTLGRAVPKGWTPIRNVNDLQAMQNDPDGKYILMNDIDASETQSWNGAKVQAGRRFFWFHGKVQRAGVRNQEPVREPARRMVRGPFQLSRKRCRC